MAVPYYELTPATLPPQEQQVPSDQKALEKIASDWIDQFHQALKTDASSAKSLFLKDGFLRDFLGLQWDLKTVRGDQNIAAFLAANDLEKNVHLSIDPKHVVKKSPIIFDGANECVQVFLRFETKIGEGRGLVRLVPVDGRYVAYTLWLGLRDIKGQEQAVFEKRPMGIKHGQNMGREIWKDVRQKTFNFEDSDPVVMVIGAGQGGLTVAARLQVLGIPSLIVESNPRVGDNWRNRYRSLVLHDPVWYDHLPYIDFPANWPVFTPKDKLGDWFEAYASAMELNVWLSSKITSTSFDKEKNEWNVEVTRSDGAKRTLKPRHIVLATGHSGEPNVPHFPGEESFKGSFFGHSSKWPGASKSNGKKALVVGCCNSAHDIAQAYYENDAKEVTMLQRSSTYVMSSKWGIEGLLGGLYCEGGPPVEDADVIFYSIPNALLMASHTNATKWIEEKDKTMIDGLEKAGFRIQRGPNDAGFFMLYFHRGGGYYINVGASELISQGKIKVKSGEEIKRVLPDGVEFTDGSKLEADEIVLATGYQNMRTTARKILGDKVADQCTDVWGFSPEEQTAEELRTVWRRSGHKGLWFMGGNLALAREMSRYLALQIQAIELGHSDY